MPSVLSHMYADYVPPQNPSILFHSFNWFNYMRILLQRYVVNLAWSLGRRIEAVCLIGRPDGGVYKEDTIETLVMDGRREFDLFLFIFGVQGKRRKDDCPRGPVTNRSRKTNCNSMSDCPPAPTSCQVG